MKRVLVAEKEYSSLKPVFGQSGAKPPFYDPYDSHLHIWVDGVLKSEEDHKNMYLSKKVDQSFKRCTYCSVCHEIKPSVNKITIRDHYSDKLFPIMEIADDEESQLENRFNYIDRNLTLENTSSESTYVENDKSGTNFDNMYKSLFLPKRGIYDNYIKVDEESVI